MGKDGNKPTCVRGSVEEEVEQAQRFASAPTPNGSGDSKSSAKLVRVGSKLYGKNTHTEKKFNIGFRIEKAPGGVAFRTQNELVVDKQREYKLLERGLPTYPGERSGPEEALPPLVEEDGEEESTVGVNLG